MTGTNAPKEIRRITKEEAEQILTAFCYGYPNLVEYHETMQRLREREPSTTTPRSTVRDMPQGTP